MKKNKWKIDKYFLEEKNPYSKRRPIKTKSLLWAFGIILVLFILSVLVFGGDERKPQPVLALNFPTHAQVPNSNQGVAIPSSTAKSAGFFGLSLGMGGISNLSARNRSANQVIRRGTNGNDPGAASPMGEGIPVKLLNAILSTDSASPAIAEVTDDVYAHGTLSIPRGTHAIGSAHYDEPSHRIQLRFQAFVYPEGDEHAVDAVGMMSDGSTGLEGDYHSGEGKRQVGQFLSHFASGMAQGMQNRDTVGAFGSSVENGSVKNGVLSGISLSAEDEAKSYSDDLNKTKPFMTLPAGQNFILFLEKSYTP